MQNAADGELISDIWEARIQSVTSVNFSPDKTRIASGSIDRTVRLWNIKGNSTELVGHTDGVMLIAFSLDGNRHIATDSRDQTIRILGS